MCFFGGGGGGSQTETPFEFSKWQVSTKRDFIKNPFMPEEAAPADQAATPINLKEDLGITDPMDEVKDTGRDKRTLDVSEDDATKTDRFKRRQRRDNPYEAPKQDGFLNIVR